MSKICALLLLARLLIPSLDIDVGLTECDYNDPWTAQAIVDAEDSAAIFAFGDELVIADHNNQGFATLHNAEQGVRAYVDGDEYYCIRVTTGGNGPGIYTSDGVQLSEQNPGGIAMYTCNGEWWDILITLWQPVPPPNYLPPIREETQ